MEQNISDSLIGALRKASWEDDETIERRPANPNTPSGFDDALVTAIIPGEGSVLLLTVGAPADRRALSQAATVEESTIDEAANCCRLGSTIELDGRRFRIADGRLLSHRDCEGYAEYAIRLQQLHG